MGNGKVARGLSESKCPFPIPGDPEGTAERGDSGAQERWRTGTGTQEQLVSRQKGKWVRLVNIECLRPDSE